MKGTVKFFNETKGFGFIAGDDGKEYFVHVSGVSEGTTLNDNDSVEFETEQGDRGPKAVNVRPAGEGAAEEAPAEDDEAAEESSDEEEAEVSEDSEDDEEPTTE